MLDRENRIGHTKEVRSISENCFVSFLLLKNEREVLHALRN